MINYLRFDLLALYPKCYIGFMSVNANFSILSASQDRS